MSKHPKRITPAAHEVSFITITDFDVWRLDSYTSKYHSKDMCIQMPADRFNLHSFAMTQELF